MWLDIKEQSRFSYKQCIKLKKEGKEDINELWRSINDSEYAYWYCLNIEDKLEVRKYISTSFFAWRYCLDIKNDPQVRKYITNKSDICCYCRRHINTSDILKCMNRKEEKVSIIQGLLKEIKSKDLDFQVKSICDKIIEEEKDNLKDLEEKPAGVNIFLFLPCKTSKKELSFLCLEREIGYYVVTLRSKIKGTKSSLKRVKVWDVREDKAEKIFKKYAEVLKHLNGEI